MRAKLAIGRKGWGWRRSALGVGRLRRHALLLRPLGFLLLQPLLLGLLLLNALLLGLLLLGALLLGLLLLLLLLLLNSLLFGLLLLEALLLGRLFLLLKPLLLSLLLHALLLLHSFLLFAHLFRALLCLLLHHAHRVARPRRAIGICGNRKQQTQPDPKAAQPDDFHRKSPRLFPELRLLYFYYFGESVIVCLLAIVCAQRSNKASHLRWHERGTFHVNISEGALARDITIL